MKLARQMIAKPWGRTDIPVHFGAPAGERIGEIWYATDDGGALPLLVKWLFTSEALSIQVHPSDAQAQASGLISGKEECWYIVDAAPDAVLGIGTTRPLSAEELRAASLSGAIENLIDWKPVKAGDYYYIPAGTVHAIGAGICLIEVQQFADITYRLYDYGRLDNGAPRELHLDIGVAVSRAAPYADHRSGHADTSRQLVDGPYFRLWLAADAAALADIPRDGLRWRVPLSGEGVGQCWLIQPSAEIAYTGPMLVAMV